MRKSEPFYIKWGHVNWEQKTIFIPKTKWDKPRHSPLRPELLRILNQAWEQAAEGEELILGRKGKNNLNRDLLVIAQRAGVPEWKDSIQHLRRCARTQLLEERIPSHAVSQWLGHGQAVGNRHYTMNTGNLISMVTEPKTCFHESEAETKSNIDEGIPSSTEKIRVKASLTGTQKSGAKSGATNEKNEQQIAISGLREEQEDKAINEENPVKYEVLGNRPGRTRTRDKGIMSPLL